MEKSKRLLIPRFKLLSNWGRFLIALNEQLGTDLKKEERKYEILVNSYESIAKVENMCYTFFVFWGQNKQKEVS